MGRTWNSHRIVKTRVDALDWGQAVGQVLDWARQRESRYVCVANVHMVMEAYDHPDFADVVNSADLVVPDGMPLVWVLRWKGEKSQPRLYGPHLTYRLCRAAAEHGVSVGFYGGRPHTLTLLLKYLRHEFPHLKISYAYSPPFRPLTVEEDKKVVADIQNSGTQILFVGLGCPKQERWMASHRGRISAVMLGVGMAFDTLAGTKPKPPAIMQKLGLEWLFRLSVEPRRLWRRYVYHNPRFIFLLLREWAKGGHS